MTGAAEIVMLPADEASPDALEACAARGAFAVLYLGSSFAALAALERALPAGWTLVPVGDGLRRAAESLRREFLDLDAAVLRPGVARDWWDATHLGERNPLSSTLGLDLARFFFLLETLRRHERLLVLCDDRARCRLYDAEMRRRGHRVGWGGPGRARPLGEGVRAIGYVLRCLARGVRVRLRGCADYRRRRRLLRSLRLARPLDLEGLRRARVLLVSWLRAETFPPGAALPDDAYLPGFAATATAAGEGVAYLMRAAPGLEDYAAAAQGALASRVPVLMFEELAPAGAMLAAAFISMALPWRVPRATLAGEDVGAILRLGAWRELGSFDVVTAFGHKALCQALARLGAAPASLAHPYEHQPWEKMLRRGLRRWLPDARVIGVQHVPFARTYLSLFPSRREIESGLIPDRLLVAGEGYADWFRAVGFPPGRLAVLGAVRYAKPSRAAETGGRGILCCTSIDLAESIELVAKAALASRGLGRTVTVNYHPATGEDFRRALREGAARIAGGDLDHLGYVDAPAATLLDDAHLVLYCTSAAVFDALLAGKPAVFVGRETDLDYDKAPDGLTTRCRTVGELRAILAASFAEPAGDAARAPRTAELERWIAPVKESILRAALSLAPREAVPA